MTSVFIYGLGLVSLYFLDLLITLHFKDNAIAQWAEVRSLVGISGTLCLIGLEMVLMRTPHSSGKLLRILIVQIPLLALPIAIAIHWLGYLTNAMIAYFLSVGSAWTVVVYQYFRSHHMRAVAQFVQQGWRIAGLVTILFFLAISETIEIEVTIVTLLLFFAGISAILILHYPPSKLTPQVPEPLGDLYRIGSRFMITSIFLALAIYGEQLLVIRVGSTTDAANYFTHATFFLFPMSIINGYIGFLLGPWVRDNHNRFIQALREHWWILLILVIFAAALMNGIGLLGWWILSPSIGEPDTLLRLIFAACSVIITLYQLPSAYNGIFAKTVHHDALILAQVLSLILALILFLFLHSVIGTAVTISVAVASFLNWTLRTASGFGIITFILKTRQI